MINLAISYKTGKIIVRCLSRLLFDINVIGRNNVPDSGPAILAANHESALETLLIPAYVDSRNDIAAVAKQELWEISGYFGRYIANQLDFWGMYPIDRSSPSPAQIKQIKRVLGSGKALMIFPEGTRQEGIHEFHDFVARLSYNNNTPVVPVSVVGTRYAENHYLHLNILKSRPKIVLDYGTPMYCTGGHRREAVADFTRSLQQRIEDNCQKYNYLHKQCKI